MEPSPHEQIRALGYGQKIDWVTGETFDKIIKLHLLVRVGNSHESAFSLSPLRQRPAAVSCVSGVGCEWEDLSF